MFLGNAVGQHIRLDHQCDVCTVVTKVAYEYLSSHEVLLEIEKLTRVMAGAQKTLFFASLFRAKRER